MARKQWREWSPEDTTLLCSLYSENRTLFEMAEALERDHDDVRLKLETLSEVGRLSSWVPPKGINPFGGGFEDVDPSVLKAEK